MHKLLVVARREYNAAVKTKSFLISVFLLPLLMGGGVLVQFLLKDQVDIQEKRFAVVDRTQEQQLVRALEGAATQRNTKEIFDPTSGKQTKPAFTIERINPPPVDGAEASNQQRFQLSERVRRGDLFGFLEIGADVYDHQPGQVNSTQTSGVEAMNTDVSTVRYQSNSPTYNDFHQWARPIIEHAVEETRFQRAGLESATIRSVLQPVPLVIKGLSEKDQETGGIKEAKDENPAVSILSAVVLVMLMFMLILVGAAPAMQGVVEEKMQRIAEMMLGSIRPFELMMGKLAGLMGVSLTLAALYLGAAYWAARYYEVAELVSPAVIMWFVAYLVVAIIMYGSLFIAVGAACSDIRDTQTMVWPVMLLAMLPMFVWLQVAKEPTSTFANAVSFFPTATPMLMTIRLAVPPGIGWWQPVVGLVVMLLTTVACVYLAGRIFRVGILMQGKGASMRDLARWIVQG
jgi:ABC-2 type transport system permease protein